MVNRRVLIGAGAVVDEPTVRRVQRFFRPIITKTKITAPYRARVWQKIVGAPKTLTPKNIQTEWDKRLHSPEREEFNLDNWNKYRVRYLNNKWNPIYQVDKYYNMEWTNIQSWRWSELWVPYSEYWAMGNNENIYRNNRLKNKYTSEDNIIKAGTIKEFWEKDSPYNTLPNQK